MKQFFLLTILFLGVTSCKKELEKTQVTVEKITESVYASGVVKSKNQYQVFSTANGLIQLMFVTEGDKVKIGDPIFQVVNKTAQFSTDNARLAAQYADLNVNSDKLSELQINIDLATAKMKSDSLLLERQRNLWAQQIGSQNEFEQRPDLQGQNRTDLERDVGA